MMWWTIILAVFATYRLATDVAWEDGPLNVFARLRGLATQWAAGHPQREWVAQGVACPICLSWWIALGFAAGLGGGVVEWLAIAGGAALLARKS